MPLDYGHGSEDIIIVCTECGKEGNYGYGSFQKCKKMAEEDGWLIVSETKTYCKTCKKGKK